MSNNKILAFLLAVVLMICPAVASATWLFWDAESLTSVPGSDQRKGIMGVGYSDRVVMFGTQDTDSMVYADGAWTEQWSNSETAPVMLFLDSRNYIYAGFDSATSLYRSTDGGETFSVVDTSATATSGPRAMTEDDDGTVYCMYRGNYDLMYSTDGGATWSAATMPTDIEGTYTDHIHAVHWCPYRSVLIISGGDNADAHCYYTSAKGAAITAASWQKLTMTQQTVGITSNANYIFGSHDQDNEQGKIWRLTWPIGGSPGVITDIYGTNTDNYSWQQDVDQNGVIFFVLSIGELNSAELVASYDGGATFSQIKTFDTDGGPSRFAMVSDYNTDWDGFYYGGSGTSGRFARYRFYADDTVFKISSTGKTTNDGVSNAWPLSAFDVLQRVVGDNGSFAFQSAITDAVVVTEDNITLNAGSYAFSGDVSDSPDFSTNFETGSFAFDSYTDRGNSTYDTAETGQANGGTYSFSVTTTADGQAGYRARMVSEITVGDSGRLWVGGALRMSDLPGSTTLLASVYGTGQEIYLAVTSNGALQLYTSGITLSEKPQTIVTTLSADTWYDVKMCVDVANAGALYLWIDGVMVLSAIGIDTYDGADFTSAWWGMDGDVGNAKTFYWDDIFFSDTDPDQPDDIYVFGNYARIKNLNASSMGTADSTTTMLLQGLSLDTLTKGSSAKVFAFDPWDASRGSQLGN